MDLMYIFCHFPFSEHLNLIQNIYQVLMLHHPAANTFVHNKLSQSYMFHSEALYTFSI